MTLKRINLFLLIRKLNRLEVVVMKLNEFFKKVNEGHGERRFRASIYVDVFVPETDDLEADREAATKEMEEYARNIPNSYVGGVASYNPHNLSKSLDKDI
jgi:hypothetical protein